MSAKRYKPTRRLKPKRSRLKKVARNRFFWFGLALLFVVLGLGYGVFFTPFFQIRHIEVQGAQKVSPQQLTEMTREHIPKKLVFFEINNLFLADASAVAREIQTAFPEVENVAVDPMLPNKVKVIVKERGAVATWCQEECFALDATGVIFEKKEPDRGVIVQNGRKGAVLGEQVIDPATLKKILAFQQQMDSFALFQEVGLRVSTLSVISEERVNAKISEGWDVYFNPAENLEWQITKAQLVLDEKVPFQERPILEYIDLRFGDQAYIKYKENRL